MPSHHRDPHRLPPHSGHDVRDTLELNTALAAEIHKPAHAELGVCEDLLDWALHLYDDEASKPPIALINLTRRPATPPPPTPQPVPPTGYATRDRFGHLLRLTS